MSASPLDEGQVKAVIVAVHNRSPERRPLRAEDLDPDFPLYSLEEGEASLGLDSLDAVEIATDLEEAFDVVLPNELDPSQLRTVRDVMLLLEQTLREQREGVE
jgi:acyl carrier protein